jgi:hypothetical protein
MSHSNKLNAEKSFGKIFKIIQGVGALILVFDYDILRQFIGLPQRLVLEGTIIFTATIGVLAIALHYSPKLSPHRKGFRQVIGVMKESLCTFLIVGIAEVFYPLNMVLLPYYMHWEVPLLFFLEIVLFVDLWSIRQDYDWVSKLVKFIWNHASRPSDIHQTAQSHGHQGQNREGLLSGISA